MKIGLIYPNEGKKEKAIHLGLGYIAAYARTQYTGLNFCILDTRIASKREKQKFYSTKFDLVGITLMSGIFNEALSIAKEIKRNNPGQLICVGGPFVSSLEKEILEFGELDLAVLGEGEVTFSEIIEYVLGKRTLETIDGLIYRNIDGAIRMNKPRMSKIPVDNLPIPAYDLFRMNEYPNYRIVSSRGCPFKCSFCSSADVWQYKWQKRDPARIIGELKLLVDTYGRKTFFFNDDTFNMSAKRAEEFCDLLIQSQLKILWNTPFRADRVDKNLADKMKKAGCYNVAIGIESADNGLLQSMEKQTTIEQITAGIKILRQAGIEVLGQFIIGIPGETPETFNKTLTYALNCELDFVLFYSALPYKRTNQWDYIEENGRFISRDMHNFHDIKPRIVFETPGFSYDDRARAIKTAEKAGFYVDDNRLSHVFDFGRTAAKYFQQILPADLGNFVYLKMKNFYRTYMKGSIVKN